MPQDDVAIAVSAAHNAAENVTASKADVFLVISCGDVAEVKRARGALATAYTKQIRMRLLAEASQVATA